MHPKQQEKRMETHLDLLASDSTKTDALEWHSGSNDRDLPSAGIKMNVIKNQIVKFFCSSLLNTFY